MRLSLEFFGTAVDNQNKPYLTPRKTGSEKFGDLPSTTLLGLRGFRVWSRLSDPRPHALSLPLYKETLYEKTCSSVCHETRRNL